MIKAIIFDLWNVLATKEARVFDQIAKELNLDNSAHPYFVELLEQMELGRMDEATFWNTFCQKFAIDPAAQRITPWIEHYQKVTRINDELVAYATELRANGYHTAILSNTDTAAMQHMKNIGLVDKFDAAIFSCEIGALKPSPKIYHAALQQLKVRPEEAVFTDDQPAWVEAAKKLGIHGIIYKQNVNDYQRRLTKLLSGTTSDT